MEKGTRMNDRVRKYVPCTYRAPLRASVELPHGRWGTREWLPGERERYEELVLMKPKYVEAQR